MLSTRSLGDEVLGNTGGGIWKGDRKGREQTEGKLVKRQVSTEDN